MATPTYVLAQVAGANFQDSLTLSVNLGSGSNRALMIVGLDWASGARAPTACTVNGVAMTVGTSTTDANSGLVFVPFTLAGGSLPTGTQNIVLTMNSSGATGKPMMVVALYDSVSAVATPVIGKGKSPTASWTASSASGRRVVVIGTCDSGVTGVPTGSETERVETASGLTGYVLDLVSSSSSTTLSTALTPGSPSPIWDGFAFDLTGTAAAPTAVTISGPSSGTVSVASSNFTVGTDNPITSGTITVTPSSGGGGGTFSPTSVALSSGTATATFTYTPASTGAKSITVTNDGSLTNPGALTYTSNAAGPTIGTQPSNQTVTAPSTAIFSVVATGTGTLTYQWQRQPAAGGGYSNISGATSSSYTTGATTVTGGSHNNGDTYRCNVTDSNGTTTTSVATLTVNAALAGLTSSPLKNNTGTLQLSAPLEAYVSNPTTGALVVKKTGLTSHASTGVVTFTDAALTAATAYRVVWRRTDTSAEGLETLTAA